MIHFPPPLMTSEPGSFTRATIVERKPQIIRQVIQDNDYPPEIVRALELFCEEIASYPMQPLRESAPDIAGWNTSLEAYAGKTWLEVPWYFAEVFFYRKLLEATRYFQTEGKAQSFPETERQANGWRHPAVSGRMGTVPGFRGRVLVRSAAAFLPVGEPCRLEQLHCEGEGARRAGGAPGAAFHTDRSHPARYATSCPTGSGAWISSTTMWAAICCST